MQTEYRLIKGHPGYRVGADGSVWSCRNNRWGLCDTWHMLKIILIRPKGCKDYCRAAVRLGRGKMFYVHHLVLEAFISERPEGCEACHKDGNPLNNQPANLYWGSTVQNDADMRAHGRKKGERHHAALLNDDLVREIRRCASKGESHTSIGERLGIQRRNVSKVVAGTRWGHVR